MEKIKPLGNNDTVDKTNLNLKDVEILAHKINDKKGTCYLLKTTPADYRIYDAKGNLYEDCAKNPILKYLEVCPLSDTTYYFYNNTSLGEYIIYNQSGNVILEASKGNTITANKSENGETDFILCITSDTCPPYTLTINSSSSFKYRANDEPAFPVKAQYLKRYLISKRPLYFYNNTIDGNYAVYGENTQILSALIASNGNTITTEEINADGKRVFYFIPYKRGVKWPFTPVITRYGKQELDSRSPHND